MPVNPPRGLASLGETARLLLFELIEAQRDLPRAPWIAVRMQTETRVMRADRRADMRAYWGDIFDLADVGAIRWEQGKANTGSFDIIRAGFTYYEEVKSGSGMAEVEAEVGRYLDTDDFKRRHARSWAKWEAASKTLWSDEASDRLTSIGHDCRESLQAFGVELVDAFKPKNAPSDVNKDYAKVKAVLDQERGRLGQRVAEMLDALLHYWGTVTDLVQRQEHNPSLTWEDARRAVFQTAVVMFEVDRALSDRHRKGLSE